MYRILIADDEGIAIDSIVYILQHTYGEQCELQTARSGRAVVELAETFRPDIAVMDIQMPGIGGIDAIREIRKFLPKTIFLVVTAYDRFSYAKEAMDLGVMRYLTKPLDREVFVDAMNTAMRELDRERARRSQDLRTMEKLETVVPVIETGFVYSMLLQNNAEEDLKQYCDLLEIHSGGGYMMLIECGEEVEEEAGGGKAEERAPLQGERMSNPIGSGIRIQQNYNQIREIIKEFSPQAIPGQIMMNKIPVYIPHDKTEPDYNERKAMIEKGLSLVRRLEDKTQIHYHIGIGSVKPIAEMKESYQEALRSLHESAGAVSHADDLPVACEYEDNYPIEEEKTLFACVEHGDVDGTNASAERFFSWMERTQASENMKSVRLKSLEFVLWAQHIAYAVGSMGVYRITDRQDYMDICQEYDLPMLHTWFVTQITEAAQKIAGKTNQRAGGLVEQAVDYIHQHYQEDLALDDVSRAVNISSYYFSKVFKEKIGVTFVEYLTNLRMEQAKKLLENPDNSVRDVCFAVGYQDPNYFSRTFKRMTGVTPTEYRGQGD